MSHQFINADFEEPVNINGQFAVRVFKHGDRLRLGVESYAPPVVLTKPRKIIDKFTPPKETEGRPT